MGILQSKNLLLIAPHFKVFIRDQVVLIRPYFGHTIVLIPTPYFSSLMINMPFAKKYFTFLGLTIGSRTEGGKDLELVFPRFFTLPLEVLRKRYCFLAARSCKKAFSESAIDPSLVHAHFLANGFIGAVFKNLLGTPLIVTAHGSEVYDLPSKDGWYKNLVRYVLNEADKVISVSQFNAEKLLSLGVPSNKLHVIPNGYDGKLFNPIPLYNARKKLGLPLGKKILLSVGNLESIKGHSYLIDSMQIVSRTRKNTLLVIVGSGILKGKLQKRIEALGLKQKVMLVGSKEHTEVSTWMNACDIFVLPSLGEGFPTVIPEAMACGKPVIATRVGGVPEAISSSELGTLVAPKDPEALSQGILEGLNRRWLREEILNKAQSYSWNNIVNRILAIYEKMLPENN